MGVLLVINIHGNAVALHTTKNHCLPPFNFKGQYSLIIGVIYAISDEIHQCFTPGRGPLVTDVIIDTMGVLLGILLVVLVIKIYEKLIIKHKKQKDITKVEINN